MGTRNVTSVVLNGKQVVCQYGQWDGYPSYTGVKILEFLRDADMERLKKTLENTKISVVNYEQAKTYTGSTKDILEIGTRVYKVQSELNQYRDPSRSFWGCYDTVKHMMEHNMLTRQEADDYLVSTRDIGCDILSVIYDRPSDSPPLELFAITEEFQGEYSFDIQGIYVIDLDKGIVKMTYDGYSQQYDLSHLPEDIDLEMNVFEKITQKLYEVSRDNGRLKEKQLSSLAAELAGEIAAEMKEEYPELIAKLGDLLSLESYGFDLIYKMICEKHPEGLETESPITEFIFDEEIMVSDDMTHLEGYIWAGLPLVDRLKALSPALKEDQSMEKINFYPIYDLQNKKVTLEGHYYLEDGFYARGRSFTLPLMPEESNSLIAAFENYCRRKTGLSCLDFLNQTRQQDGKSPLPCQRLEEQIQSAQKQSMESEALSRKQEPTISKPEITAPEL